MGLNLVGYYQACERIDDTALAPVGERVAGKLKDGFKNAVALVVRQFSATLGFTHTYAFT
jgi:hypothetical protein